MNFLVCGHICIIPVCQSPTNIYDTSERESEDADPEDGTHSANDYRCLSLTVLMLRA